MSETITDPVVEPAPVPEPVAAPEAPVTQEATDPVEPVAAIPEPAPVADAKPKQGDRRFAQVTARLAAESERASAAERRAEAAEALLSAAKPPDTPPAPVVAASREEEIRQEAARQVATQTLNAQLSRIDANGKKTLGAEAWEAAKATMTALGATANNTFLQALAEAEAPEKVFAALSEDADGLVELLAKPPTAMAAAIGRMDAKLAQPPAPVVRPLSAAPRPAAPITPAAILPDASIYDDGLSMAEWNAAFEKSDLAKKLLRPRAGR